MKKIILYGLAVAAIILIIAFAVKIIAGAVRGPTQSSQQVQSTGSFMGVPSGGGLFSPGSGGGSAFPFPFPMPPIPGIPGIPKFKLF